MRVSRFPVAMLLSAILTLPGCGRSAPDGPDEPQWPGGAGYKTTPQNRPDKPYEVEPSSSDAIIVEVTEDGYTRVNGRVEYRSNKQLLVYPGSRITHRAKGHNRLEWSDYNGDKCVLIYGLTVRVDEYGQFVFERYDPEVEHVKRSTDAEDSDNTGESRGRIWTNRDGRQIEAEFVERSGNEVTLCRTSDQQTFTISLNSLSDADQDFLASKHAMPMESVAVDASAESGKSTPEDVEDSNEAELLKIPLLVQRGGSMEALASEWGTEEAKAAAVKKALATSADRGCSDDSLAIAVAASYGGKMAGFDFDPVVFIDSGEKPLERVPPDSEYFMLLWCQGTASEMPVFGKTVLVYQNRALLKRDPLEVVFADGTMSMGTLDEDKTTDHESTFSVEGTHLASRIASTFLEDFGWNVLVPMQQKLMKDEISNSIERISTTGSQTIFVPITTEPTRGNPELVVTTRGAKRVDLYLRTESEKPFRKCMISPGTKVDEFGKLPKGNWSIYVEAWPEDSDEPRRCYCDTFAAKGGQRYVIEIAASGNSARDR